MRQAGRYMKQYPADREKHGNPGDLQTAGPGFGPSRCSPFEILDVDAAIIFADLLLPIEPMGLKLRYEKGSGRRSITGAHPDDVDSLPTAYTDDLRLRGRGHPAHGAGPGRPRAGNPASWALLHHGAVYMIEGGRLAQFLIRTKKLMYRRTRRCGGG